jgi:hypothetical protein
MGRRRTALVAVLTIVSGTLIGGCGGEATQSLRTFNGPGYSVLMPGKPDRSVNTVKTAAGAVRVVAYVSDSADRAFAIASTTLPAGLKGDLDGAVQGAATNIGGTVRDKTKTTHQGFPARDARVTGAKDKDGNAGTVFARFILAKDRLYQLQFVTKGSDVKSPGDEYDKFIGSLKIK